MDRRKVMMRIKRFFRRRYTGKRVDKGPGRFMAWWGKRRRAAKIAMIAGASVAVLLLGSLAALKLWIRPPAEADIILNFPTPSEEPPPSGASPLPFPSGSGEPDPQPQYVKRDGVYTFLLAGVNEGLTDTLMVATLDTELGTCHILSIPRDTVVGRAPRTVRKINSAYSQRNNTWDDEPGIAQMKKEVATLIGFQPQYTAVLDYNAFKRLIGAIDGVDFYVPMDMYVYGEGIDLKKGQQLLSADKALQLVRFRVNQYPDPGDPRNNTGYNDQGRMKVQQDLLRAAGKKALSNWTKFPEYIRIARDNVESDVDWGRLLWFAGQINDIGMDNVVFSSLPTATVRHPAEISGDFYETVVAEEALALINETINPFGVPIGEELVEYTILTEK